MGLERARKEGKKIGRPKGKAKKYKLTRYKTYIQNEIENGRSINNLSKELNVTWTTLKNYIETTF